MRRLFACLTVFCDLAVLALAAAPAAAPTIDAAFQKYWDARNPQDAARDPLPQKLTWEIADRDAPGRAHWLVIDRIAPAQQAEPPLQPDLNVFSGAGSNRGRVLFGRARPSGRADLVRTGNTVQVTSKGVAEFTLLLSPDVFDFAKPIAVTANGRAVADARVEPSVATLMKGAARDNDRTMLFGAELHIAVK